jgi:FkbM family methyltransferase
MRIADFKELVLYTGSKVIPPSIKAKLWKKFYKRMVKKLGINKTGNFTEDWLKTTRDGGRYFDFNGALICDTLENRRLNDALIPIFLDTLLIHCFYNNDYDKLTIKLAERFQNEGPYGYSDGIFDVTVKPNDVVIDAGAWIGDFAAYAACKGAITYAFEPANETFAFLKKTAELNGNNIRSVKMGLGEKDCEISLFKDTGEVGGDSIHIKKGNISEVVRITSLDKFVEENNISKIDFIKADIEGSERDMLKGAVNVLKNFSPRLALCTYHLADDPQVLEGLILAANPKYKVVQMRKKLYACVC